jgi:hypothetical protein
VVCAVADYSKATMTIPHFINEAKSDMLGIKHGWYVLDDAGKLASGPFASHEDCLKSGTQPTHGLPQSEFASTAEAKHLSTDNRTYVATDNRTYVEGDWFGGSIRNRPQKDKAS